MAERQRMTELIAAHPFARGLPEEWVEIIAGCARNRVFQPGTYLLREGDPADEFYLLRHGTVALELPLPAGEPLVFATLKEGDVLGVSWLVPPYRWQYDARAVELTRAIAFDARCLREKCEADPALGYALMKRFVPVLFERLKAARLQCADVYRNPATPG